MREIKFRVWCKDSLQWVSDNTRFEIYNGEIDLGSGDPWVFQQYTGLKDINGKEIYEGDIIKSKYLPLNENVKFLDGIFGVHINYKNSKDGRRKDNDRGDFEPLIYLDDIEIIGNIYENPDLLNG